MKCIGLLGGMSWESTESYYRMINEAIKQQRGGLESAQIAMRSVNFADIAALQKSGDWDSAGEKLGQAAEQIEAAGADMVLICTNTMHKVADQVAENLTIPLVHIADATGEALQQAGITAVGLLGTAFTMEDDFYRAKLNADYGLEVLTPNADDRARVHQVIFEELCLGHTHAQSKQDYLDIIARLTEQGAQGVILGCTEIGLLIEQADTPTPLFDTTAIHANKAVSLALSQTV